jgi:hypothetical protein
MTGSDTNNHSVRLEPCRGDVPRAFYAQLGPILLYFALLVVGGLVSATVSVLDGESPSNIGLIMVVMGAVFVASFIVSLRANAKVGPVTLTFNAETVSSKSDAAEVTLRWDAVTKVVERAGVLLLQGNNIRFVLPIYRLDAQTLSAIDANVSRYGLRETAKRDRRKGWLRIVLLWALLLIMFTFVYHLIAPSP